MSELKTGKETETSFPSNNNLQRHSLGCVFFLFHNNTVTIVYMKGEYNYAKWKDKNYRETSLIVSFVKITKQMIKNKEYILV